VIDWGLAADVSDEPSDLDDRVPHVSQLNSIAGTPLYWAPELADGTATRCCPATDVFLLGALLYEILTGCAPYKICDPNKIGGLTPKDIGEIRFLEVGPMLRAIRGIIIPPRLVAPKDEAALEIFKQRETSLWEMAPLFPGAVPFLYEWYWKVAEFHLARGQKEEAVQVLQRGFEPLDGLEDRTPEEEELWQKTRDRLQEILGEQ